MAVSRSAVLAAATLASLLAWTPSQAQEAPAAEDPGEEAPAAGTSPEPQAAPGESQVSADESAAPAAEAESSTASEPATGEPADGVGEPVPTIAVGEDTPTAEAAPGDAVTLDDIQVTATKRRQSARAIPSTINVMTGEKLEIKGARELADFVDEIPGLQIQDNSISSSRKIVIRGIAPEKVGNQTVGTLLGDVPLNDAIGSYTVIDPDTWDLETFEVLKGPQGTLFGASSLAGIIRYVPTAPQLGLWQAKGAVEYMSVKEGGTEPTFSLALNAPVGDTLAFRLSGVVETRPGVIDIETPNRPRREDADEARKWAGRAAVLWQATDKLVVNAWYMAQERTSDEQFFTTNWDAQYNRTDAPSKSPSERAFQMGVIDARYSFDWATLVSLSAVQHKTNDWDIDASYVLFAPMAEDGTEVGRTKRDVEAKGFMQEFRLVSGDEGPWLWQGGVFFSTFDAAVDTDIFFTDPVTSQLALLALPPGSEGAVTTENGVSLGRAILDPLGAKETALFGEVTRELGSSLNVTLGGRYYKTATEGTSTVSGIAPFAATGNPETVENLSVRDSGFSPKLAVAWQATNDVLAYGTVSRGFQYGGVNNRAVPSPGSTSPRTYKSSTLWNYEAGLRTDWLDRTLRADITAFYMDWTDAQIAQQVPPADFYLDNVGEVKVKGVEAQVRYFFPIEGLSLDTTGGYLDSKTASAFTAGDGTVVPAGAEMPNAPKFQYSAGLNYARLFGEVWSTNTGFQFSHIGKSVDSVEGDGRLDERDMLNFNFTLSRPDLRYAPSLGLVVNNVTDERKITSATEDPEIYMEDPSRSIENFGVGYTRPRTIILRLAASFQ